MALYRFLRGALVALPFLLALYIVGLHASLGRPLWIDEFTHFAFAAEPSTAEAWALFRATADNIHHGQTGIYVLLNYWTLSNFGPDATLLRLPSMLSGLLLFGSAIMLFRVLGFTVLWQIVLVAALTGQHLLMYFLGEARPYAPIPAASAALLLYYIARPLHPHSRLVLGFGILTAVFGAIMHAYFAVYWPAICLVAYVHRQATTGAALGLRSLLRFANPPLVALGAGLYLLLAALTWLRGQPHFALDPFEWMRGHGLVANFTAYSHTQFLDDTALPAALFTLAAALGTALLPARLRGSTAGLWAPALLVVLAVGISVLLSWISWLSDYWILTRQWVGSVALVAIGVVWFWAEAARVWSRLSPSLGLAACGLAALLVSGQAIKIQRIKLAELQAWLATPPPAPDAEDCEPPASLDTAAMSNDERNTVMVDLANRNIACGGAIWPIFRSYYAGEVRQRHASR